MDRAGRKDALLKSPTTPGESLMGVLVCSLVLFCLPTLPFSQSTNDPAYDAAIDEAFPDPGLIDPWITEYPDITIVEIPEWINPLDSIYDTADYRGWFEDILNETSPDNVLLKPGGWLDLNPIDDDKKAGDLEDAAQAIGEMYFEIYKDQV